VVGSTQMRRVGGVGLRSDCRANPSQLDHWGGGERGGVRGAGQLPGEGGAGQSLHQGGSNGCQNVLTM
jgi:hypothetical protein